MRMNPAEAASSTTASDARHVRGVQPARWIALLLLLLAGLMLGACSPKDDEDEECDGQEECCEDDDGCGGVQARLTVQNAILVGGEPPPPSLDPQAPTLTSPEQRRQTVGVPASVPLDVAIDAIDGVAALLLRVNEANEHFRVETTQPRSASISVPAKDLFQLQLVLQIPNLFRSEQFCVDVAAVDLAGRVSNYQRICFVLPSVDPDVAVLPLANAGGPKAVTRGSTGTLDGSGSQSANGSPLATFQWTQLSGPTVALTGATTAVASFTAPNDANTTDLGFRLTVTDSTGRISRNDTLVRVNEVTVADLAGTWVIPQNADNGPFTITFFKDGTYVKGGREDDPDCVSAADVKPGGNGVEWGRFDYDSNAGTFQVQGVFFDNDGDCGLFERDQATQDVIHLALSGNTLTITDTMDFDTETMSFDSVALTRAPISTGIVGSWQLDDGLRRPIVFTFFADGSYVMAHVSGAEDPLATDATAGVEVGTWSVDAANVLTTSSSLDSNSDGGIADIEPGSTLQVVAGRLELVIPSEGTYRFDRLPRADIIAASDLLGAWYFVDPLAPPPTAADADALVLYRGDGTYLLGDDGDSVAECVADYVSRDPSLAAQLDPEGGAESTSWILDTGSGRVLAIGPATVDTDGECGLFDRFGAYPANSLFATVVDADTLDINANGDFSGQLQRIPSTPANTAGSAALVGAWVEDTTGELLAFFQDGTFFFTYPLDNGGIERGNWSLDAATDVITIIFDPATNPNCIDTVGSEDSCVTETGVADPEALTFNADRTIFTVPSDGSPGDPPGGFVYRKVLTP